MPQGSRASTGLAGLGLALAIFATAAWVPVCAARAQEVPGSRVVGGLIYHNSRAFRIPFKIDDADRSRIQEVRLYVSSDLGQSWALAGKVSAQEMAFTFHSERDAEYWFTVRTLDTRGRLFPPDDAPVEPNMRVVVDTTPPTLVLASLGRRGERAKVRWEITDENLNVRTLALKYRTEGARDWRQVPITQPALIGAEEWNSGTAAPLKVQAVVEDLAGNQTGAEIDLSAGVAAASERKADDQAGAFGPPPPVVPIRQARQTEPGTGFDSGMGGFGPPVAAASNPDQFFGPPDGFNPNSASPSSNRGSNGYGSGNNFTPRPVMGAAGTITGAEALPEIEPMLVSSPRFNLQYAVDGASQSGPALVELWVTRDGGRTWAPQPEDVDRASPYPIDLGGEGTYGLWLVVQSASGLGDPPPQPGDRPMQWVVVDTTPPAVTLEPPMVGYGPQLGKVLITWRAADPHMDQRPVVLSYRDADQPGGDWIPLVSDRIDNTGRFVWEVPVGAPPRLHLRIDVIDKLGNKSMAETTTSGQPVIVDRSRPRGRILGLDPNATENAARR